MDNAVSIKRSEHEKRETFIDSIASLWLFVCEEKLQQFLIRSKIPKKREENPHWHDGETNGIGSPRPLHH